MPPSSHSWTQERGVVRWAGALVLTLTLHGAALAAGLMRWDGPPPPVPPKAAIMVELAPLPVSPPALQAASVPEPRLPRPAPLPFIEPEPPAEPPAGPIATAAVQEVPDVPLPEREPEVTLPKPQAKPAKEETPPAPKPKEKAAEKPPEKPAEKPLEKAETASKQQKSQQQAAQPQRKPVETPPAPSAAPTSAADAAPAPSPATAPQQAALPAQQAASVAAAPSATDLARLARAEANWQAMLLAHLERHKRYPKAAQRRNQQGTSLLRLRLDRSGRVLSYALAESSGFSALDDEVVAMIERAQPLPALPPEMPQPVLEVVVPVAFALK